MCDLYLHYKSRISECETPGEYDQVISSAFGDYMADRLTDTEYGKIYFACVDRINRHFYAGRRCSAHV